ncbi:MAG: SBBP repeat-containing protein [Cellulosilyticaceae bacterium]
MLKLTANGQSLVYGTYLGGSEYDYGNAIAVDTAGNTYMTGTTTSTNFPVYNPLYPSYSGNQDAYVAKFTPVGAPVYITYLGGSSGEDGNGIATDTSGNAYITGWTYSSNFPVVNPLYSYNGSGMAFVTKINTAGTVLLYSTYLGGNGYQVGRDIVVDTDGNMYIVGYTVASNFPTKDPYQVALKGYQDVFVTKMNAAGNALLFSTYLGGSYYDYGEGIALDAKGNIYITGYTDS